MTTTTCTKCYRPTSAEEGYDGPTCGCDLPPHPFTTGPIKMRCCWLCCRGGTAKVHQ